MTVLLERQVARRTGLTATAARAAKTAAAAAVFPFAPVTALDLLGPGPHTTARMTTGCAVLDAALRGGAWFPPPFLMRIANLT